MSGQTNPLTGLAPVSSSSTFTDITVTNNASIGNTVTTQNLTVLSGGSSVHGSDTRFKKNMRNIENIWYGYERIKGQFFDYKYNNKSSIGFMADQVEKVFPYLVQYDTHGYRYLEYTPLIGYNWEGIKDNRRSILHLDRVLRIQQKQIYELREQNRRINLTNNRLESEIVAIRRILMDNQRYQRSHTKGQECRIDNQYKCPNQATYYRNRKTRNLNIRNRVK